MAETARKRLTYLEYVDLERATDHRHEFLDGQARAMAGGSLRHSRIKVNVIGELRTALRGSPCRPYDSDLKLIVPATGLVTYPDAAVICGQPERHPDDPHAATNPALVVEVLSPSTEAWDRGGKFEHLGELPSLRHYLLVSQDRVRVTLHTRRDGAWELTRYGAGERVTLEGIGVSLSVDALYEDLPDDEPGEPGRFSAA